MDTSRIREAVRWFHDTRDAALTRDLALLITRALLAWIFIYHGAGTLFGAFHQSGIHGETVYFQSEHLQPAHFLAFVDGTTQFVGGILIAVGVLGRLAGIALVGDMIGAMVTITFAQGLVGPNGLGYQINLLLIIPSLFIAFLGTGRFSLDELFTRLRGRRSDHHETPTARPLTNTRS
ncbi:MAG TPA: DoxX family protein [Acidimicrobiales bacterium]|nr:DoxX family protein [Acidimicrobiales bacterium]